MGQVTKKVKVEKIYNETPEYKHNIQKWMEATNLAEGRANVVPFRGHRYTEMYRQSRFNKGTGSYYPSSRPILPPRTARAASPPPPVHPRSIFSPAKKPAPAKKTRTVPSGMDDSDSDLTDLSSDDNDDDADSGMSPKPIKDFKPFSAEPSSASQRGMSIPSDAARTGSAFTSARFGDRPSGGARGSGMDSDDDEGDNDVATRRNGSSRGPGIATPPTQEIGLDEDPISLEQARRIAQQSIWRMRA